MPGGQEQRIVDPETGAAKGSKLARFDLIPPRPMKRVAEVYGIGSRKYEDRNWEKGYAWGLSLAALERHLNLWVQGEQFATDDGQHHLASVIWHCLTLMEFEETHPEKDDVHVLNGPRTPVVGPDDEPLPAFPGSGCRTVAILTNATNEELQESFKRGGVAAAIEVFSNDS